ncbi:Dolichol-phosphate mannosyltransferase subunit 3 [Verticillium dahliae VDG2]|nr:Dolichol-phosphate mannosyltransferase subunit 3 [Verticillium dahliae VDG2]
MVSTAGGIVIAIIILALAGALAWVIFTQLRARKLGADSYGPYGAYDEQELGDRGRSAGHAYQAQVHRNGGGNPFDDDAEPSNIGGLRGVSPRPIDTGAATQQQGQQGPKGGSPTERRSMFRENV